MQPFTVHEAEIALYHAWPDGFPVSGPLNRHLASAVVDQYRDGLRITRSPEHEHPSAFGDWRRESRSCGSLWTIETSAPFSALSDGSVEISSTLSPGTPLIVLIRFLCRDTGRWRIFQFHDAELEEPDTNEASQIMMSTYRFRAGWMEEFMGPDGGFAAPSMIPRMLGVVEWVHLGRRIPCWYYDPYEETWQETSQNLASVEGEPVRYISIDEEEEDIFVSYLAARTIDTLSAGLPATAIGWQNAAAIKILASSGLIPQVGWQIETGAPEPITIPTSGRHWDHPQVRFRFLSRIYATLAHGIFAVPSYFPNTAPDEPLDLPIRLGRLVLLPDSAHVVP